MDRRSFLCTAALSALATATTSPLLFGQSISQRQPIFGRRRAQRGKNQQKIPIAVQLYSVHRLAASDLAGTLDEIAKMGYDGVEFAGYYGNDPKDIRKMLDNSGLKCAGTHTDLRDLEDDRFDRTAEIHNILGGKLMIAPIVPYSIENALHDVDTNKRLAERFNVMAEKAKPYGLFVGTHGGEGRLVDGIPASERFFNDTVPEVVMQIDIAYFMSTGGDPYKMIEKYKGRSKTIHLKESGRGGPIIGSGNVDWDRIFSLCETVGGTEWYVAEDEGSADDFGRIAACIKALRAMGK